MSNEQAAAQVERLRAAFLEDAAWQNELQALDDLDAFIPRALALAATRGIHLESGDLERALRPDPLGLSRWSQEPPGAAVPQAGWLPIQVVPAQGELCIDWAYFGARPLVQPFFEDSIRVAMRRPLNRLARFRTRLIDLPAMAERHLALRPSGFIFHMSRCGSTLVAQMLAADRRNIVVSEAGPLDTVVQVDTGADTGLHDQLLTAMTGALGQRRTREHERYFVKLDSWHTMALPLFRRAFPDVPWVFLYREPGAVLASQMAQRGIQTVPEYLPPALFGLSADDTLDPASYCALVLARTCEAVFEPYAKGGGLLVNYRDLPGALESQILPHFAIAPDAQARAFAAGVATHDAKAPGVTFSGISEVKRNLLTDTLRATAERHIGAVYRRLETLRQAG